MGVASVTVTRPNGDAEVGGSGGTRRRVGESQPAAYSGPPPTVPPPPEWQPPVEIEPPPPRELPRQDHAGLDSAEQSARTLTYGIGMVAGAIVLIVFCALCSRVLF